MEFQPAESLIDGAATHQNISNHRQHPCGKRVLALSLGASFSAAIAVGARHPCESMAAALSQDLLVLTCQGSRGAKGVDLEAVKSSRGRKQGASADV